MTRNALGEVTAYGILTGVGAVDDFGIQPNYGAGGITVSATFSTLTSSAASFTAGGAGVTLTFTAKDANDQPVQGYTPVPEAGVV